ncbi:MAG: hypothetical protein AAFQ60_00085 [Pseudomonadota bacterium]
MLVRTADWMAEISGAREIALTMVAFRAITENLVQIRVGQNDGRRRSALQLSSLRRSSSFR